jgi:hypothetical protein
LIRFEFAITLAANDPALETNGSRIVRRALQGINRRGHDTRSPSGYLLPLQWTDSPFLSLL